MLLAVEVVGQLVDFADNSGGMTQQHGQKIPATADVTARVLARAMHKVGVGEGTANGHAAATGGEAGNTAAAVAAAGDAVHVRSTVGVFAAA